jgi:hypothetical protein
MAYGHMAYGIWAYGIRHMAYLVRDPPYPPFQAVDARYRGKTYIGVIVGDI